MMNDEFDEDPASETPALTERLPDWYREIFPAGPCDGFYEKLGQHALIHVERSRDILVVTFDNLSDAGYPGYDIKAWAEKFIRDKNWSHLGVVAQGPTWFRDATLIARMEKLAADGFFARFDRVVMAGTSMGGFGAMAFADLAPGCDVVAFSPQSTLSANLVPWEGRFGKGRKQDWTLPRSDAAETLDGVGKLWVVYDPFLIPDLHQVTRLPADKVIALKAFGQGHKTALALRRMELLKTVMTEAIEGRLTPEWFHRVNRSRKDIYTYRKSMEEHLEARGKADRIPQLIKAFRVRARRKAAAARSEEAATTSTDPEPAEHLQPAPQPPAAIAPGDALQRQPKTLGNVWQLTDDGTSLRYLSDQYRHQVMGFEERDGIVLAQTPQVALGMISVGGATAIPRPLPERFDYHIRDENLGQDSAPFGAQAHGVISLTEAGRRLRALRNVIALSHPQPGITAAESAPDAPIFADVYKRVSAAKAVLQGREKLLFVDRISLDLLAGSPHQLDESDAAAHYIRAIKALRHDVAAAAGQSSLPHVVISQKPGTRTDGCSEVILAEGRLDIHEAGLGILIASPSYMLDLMPETVATLAADDRLWLDEMEAMAIDAAQNGKPWFCPALRQVFRDGADLVVEFSTMDALEFDPAQATSRHGFSLEGCTNGAKVTGLRLDDPKPGSQRVILSFDQKPEGDNLAVCYAWGVTHPKGDGDHPANHGALREVWSQDSILQPERKLRRYALSGRLPVMPSDLAVAEG